MKGREFTANGFPILTDTDRSILIAKRVTAPIHAFSLILGDVSNPERQPKINSTEQLYALLAYCGDGSANMETDSYQFALRHVYADSQLVYNAAVYVNDQIKLWPKEPKVFYYTVSLAQEVLDSRHVNSDIVNSLISPALYAMFDFLSKSQRVAECLVSLLKSPHLNSETAGFWADAISKEKTDPCLTFITLDPEWQYAHLITPEHRSRMLVMAATI